MPKLAEALVERKGLQERLTRLQGRLAANAKVQEGETPSEPPASLVEQARQVMADIKRLTLQINATHSDAGHCRARPPVSGTQSVGSLKPRRQCRASTRLWRHEERSQVEGHRGCCRITKRHRGHLAELSAPGHTNPGSQLAHRPYPELTSASTGSGRFWKGHTARPEPTRARQLSLSHSPS